MPTQKFRYNIHKMTETITLKTTTSARRLLAVFAHPDDESFGCGGMLAKYAQAGVAVHLICATKGEVGDVAADLLVGYDSIAALREAELLDAAQALGLHAIHYLGYRDSGMTGSNANQHPQATINAPLPVVAAQIRAVIAAVQPQVVVTFDPIGGYRHPDHIAMHQATLLACEQLSAQPDAWQPERWYYSTFSRWLLKVIIRVLPLFRQDPKAFGKNKDIDLTSLATVDYPLHAAIALPAAARLAKFNASECHRSQISGSPTFRKFQRWFNRTEHFMRAYPPVAADYRESSLFPDN